MIDIEKIVIELAKYAICAGCNVEIEQADKDGSALNGIVNKYRDNGFIFRVLQQKPETVSDIAEKEPEEEEEEDDE